ncbi:hypothetical protein [Curtobacterium sp. MCSS17_016]|uniref:hypothetical protein n=1 Tax=Curtobacterium sp. MCSS17_016 TaxID=2175644 RepID=UPI000DA7D9C1|nr:hypothetical protein [Curtobacterium sp. MCSS17_016]WIE81018.1 hypothetical protein DEJ19_021110 [Curtobacterium sp. MCSS17_016]
MRTPRLLLAATAAALTITALAACSAGAPTDDSAAVTQQQQQHAPDGRYASPLESRASGSASAYADWVRLPDGRKVLCISDINGGYDCNWDDIRPKDTK